MGKLPYIRNKRLYAAVMGACSYIRETGWFNKATQYYANKYGVGVDDVRKYVRIAQGNGQREAAKKKPATFKWYTAVVMKDWYCADDDGSHASWDYTHEEKVQHSFVIVKRAKSLDNLERTIYNSAGLKGADVFEVPHTVYTVIKATEYDTKREADEAMDRYTTDDISEAIHDYDNRRYQRHER